MVFLVFFFQLFSPHSDQLQLQLERLRFFLFPAPLLTNNDWSWPHTVVLLPLPELCLDRLSDACGNEAMSHTQPELQVLMEVGSGLA